MIDIAQALLADIEPNYKQEEEKKENSSLGTPKTKYCFVTRQEDKLNKGGSR